jgi:hypothetical protein
LLATPPFTYCFLIYFFNSSFLQDPFFLHKTIVHQNFPTCNISLPNVDEIATMESKINNSHSKWLSFLSLGKRKLHDCAYLHIHSCREGRQWGPHVFTTNTWNLPRFGAMKFLFLGFTKACSWYLPLSMLCSLTPPKVH